MSLAEVTMGGAVVVRGSSFKDRVYWTMDKDMGGGLPVGEGWWAGQGRVMGWKLNNKKGGKSHCNCVSHHCYDNFMKSQP